MSYTPPKTRGWGVSALLLLALVFRAAVPVGFMPSGEGAFALAICPEGMPNGAHSAHLHHGAGHDHFEHCPFGSVPAAGPVAQDFSIASPPPAPRDARADFSSTLLIRYLDRAHSARAPPALI